MTPSAGHDTGAVQPSTAAGSGLAASIVAKAAVATFVAVTFVHLFAGPIEPIGAFAAHALLVTAAYTAGFALTYVALQRFRHLAPVRGLPAPVLVAVLSAIACLAGAAVLGKLRGGDGVLSGVIDVHDDAYWVLKLVPVWFVMTAVLYQSERMRLLESELWRLTASRAKSKTATLPVGTATARDRVVEIGSGKTAQTLHIDDVSHIMAVENYCEVHFTERAGQKPMLMRATLGGVVEQLPADFVRTHRSYVVNLACVDSIEKSGRAYAAAMADGRTVPVSRSAIDDVSARWRDFLTAGTDDTQP